PAGGPRRGGRGGRARAGGGGREARGVGAAQRAGEPHPLLGSHPLQIGFVEHAILLAATVRHPLRKLRAAGGYARTGRLARRCGGPGGAAPPPPRAPATPPPAGTPPHTTPPTQPYALSSLTLTQ